MEDNMKIYRALRDTPKEARKEIRGGRLNGFTDINPAFRIKRMTEVFGPCGIGWKYVITRQEIVHAGEEAKCFLDLDLYYRDSEGEWSDAIPGIGGSSFISKERGGLYVDDECFKKALSDALGTAMKALGMSHDIYFSQDRTKYTVTEEPTQEARKPEQTRVPLCEQCGEELVSVDGYTPAFLARYTQKKYGRCLCSGCAQQAAQNNKNMEESA